MPNPKWLRKMRKKGIDLYCWDKDDAELNRRLSVIWLNSEEPSRFRYIPKAFPGRPDNSGAWSVFDSLEGRHLKREEVTALGYAQCCEQMGYAPIVMQ